LGNHFYDKFLYSNDVFILSNSKLAYSLGSEEALDTTYPRWENQTRKYDTLPVGETNELSISLWDDVALDWARLYTNETGWVRYPRESKNLTKTPGWQDVVFTWQNASIQAGTVISWFIRFNDTSGNSNESATMYFTIVAKPPVEPITEIQVEWQVDENLPTLQICENDTHLKKAFDVEIGRNKTRVVRIYSCQFNCSTYGNWGECNPKPMYKTIYQVGVLLGIIAMFGILWWVVKWI